MPFIAVVGFVYLVEEDVRATVRVASINSKWSEDTQLVDEVHFSLRPGKMEETAHKIAEKIRDTILKITSTSSKGK